jgi:hypothetical protein
MDRIPALERRVDRRREENSLAVFETVATFGMSLKLFVGKFYMDLRKGGFVKRGYRAMARAGKKKGCGEMVVVVVGGMEASRWCT